MLRAAGYIAALNLPLPTEPMVAADWPDAESIIRAPKSGDGWWEQEEAERGALMAEMQARIGSRLLLETLTSAVEGYAESTYASAMEACRSDETLAKAASGAALTAIHLHALALLAGRGADHVFVQKYDLFATGRFPLGMRRSTFIFF